MNRRQAISSLASLPFIGWIFGSQAKAVGSIGPVMLTNEKWSWCEIPRHLIFENHPHHTSVRGDEKSLNTFYEIWRKELFPEWKKYLSTNERLRHQHEMCIPLIKNGELDFWTSGKPYESVMQNAKSRMVSENPGIKSISRTVLY